MKGSIIALALLAFVSIVGWLLVRESYPDLERLESEIAASLDAAGSELDRATRLASALRAIRPNLSNIDDERTSLQRQLGEQRKNLAALETSRPSEKDARVQFVTARLGARDAAASLASAARDLADRTAVIDDFTRTGQSRLQALNDAIQRTFELRNRLTGTGKTIDPVLADKLDGMQRKRASLQELARNLYASVGSGETSESGASGGDGQATARRTPPPVERMRAEAKTIDNEARLVLADLEAAYRELAALESAK